MTLLRTILFCLLCAPAWGQTVLLSVTPSAYVTNYTFQHSTDMTNWADVKSGTNPACLEPAYEVNTNGYWTNQMSPLPQWVADCKPRNFYRVRYGFGTSLLWNYNLSSNAMLQLQPVYDASGNFQLQVPSLPVFFGSHVTNRLSIKAYP